MDEHNVEIPSTPDASLPLDEKSADTMLTETLQGSAEPDSLAQQSATVSLQDLELATQSMDRCPVTSAPEKPATLRIFKSAEDQQGQSNGVTSDSNTRDVEPPVQPIKSPAYPNPGSPITAHQEPEPTLGKHPEALATTTTIQKTGTSAETQAEAQMASLTHDRRLSTLNEHSEAPLTTATIQETDAQIKTQVEKQTASPSHDRPLEEPETREALGEAGSYLKAQHHFSDTVSRPVSEQPFHHERIRDRLAGCAEGAWLLYHGQNDANVRQDYPIEIDDSRFNAPVGSVRKRRTKNDAAAETPSARRKLRQSPSKASHPGFINWKEVLSKPDATDSRRGMLEQVEDMCRKDDQARSKKLRRVRKEIGDMQARLDDLCSTVRDLEKQEENARKQKQALRHLPANHLD